MKIIKYIPFIAILFLLDSVMAQQTPADNQQQNICIEGGTLHIGNGKIIENSLIMFSNGKINFVGSANAKIARNGEIISAKGKHIYPGFIAANSSLGLVEVDAVRATNDKDEVGVMLPHVRSLIAYNAESKVVESMRPNGVLLAQISPKGGRISGTSSIVQFDAWNWEDAVIKEDDGIHLNWPNSLKFNRRTRSYETNKEYQKQVEDLDQFVLDSKSYNSGNKNPINLPLQAMNGLFNNSKTLFVHVDDKKGIVDAISFKTNHNIGEMVIIGGYESYKVTNLLVENNIAVLLTKTQSLPESNDDDYNLPYKLPKLLTDKGVVVGFHTGNQMNAQGRNLPFYAGQAVSEGLNKEVAVQLITLNMAKILGIDENYGSLENGKSATLFISEGDALDMRTNNLSHAFIDGRMISLETHQTELWQRYSNKYQTK